jgi:ParB family transcriptional regulator, chromosome partitioning protein
MQNNDDQQKPTADSVANEFSTVRRSKILGPVQERAHMDERQLATLPLEQVDPDPNQPRRFFHESGLKELKDSIEARGQITPALVRRHPHDASRFMLIAGERRYRVLKDLGQETILVIVLPVTEQEARELALIDNLQRADLSAFEEAAGYQRLIEEFQYTQEEVAKKVGKDQTVVSNTLSINKLPESIKKDEWAQQASKSVLLELARVTDTKQLRALWGDIKKDIKAGIPISVRKVREKRIINGQEAHQASSPAPLTPDKVVIASKHLAKQLAELTPETLAASPEQLATLRAIKERLDELFAGLEPASPPLSDQGHEEAAA